MSSQGVRLAKFKGVAPGNPIDLSDPLDDPVFQIAGKNVRRVEPRNTPTMINAVLNGDNFWDGRASMVFNGVNPFGFRDKTSTLKKVVKGKLTDVKVRIPFGSLASQAVGPPVSDFEMSFQGRDFPSIGRKMVTLRPLNKQLVHPEDSVLGPYSRATLSGEQVVGPTGLGPSNYASMIKAAFQPQWWNSRNLITIQPGTQIIKTPTTSDPRTFVVNPGKTKVRQIPANADIEAFRGPNDFTLIEYNFSLFFGLAVQLYEATLVSDDTPFDRFRGANLNVRGGGIPIPPDPNALTAQEQQGLALFTSGATGCSLCHTLPETTEHTVRALQVNSQGVPGNLLRFLPDGNGGLFIFPSPPPKTAYIDFGMRNLAHRPSVEDIGRDGTTPDLPPFRNSLDGNKPFPLSYVELWKLKKAAPTKLPSDVAAYVPDTPNAVIPGTPAPLNDKSVTKGAFKVPNLRNSMLTGPYFHDGTYSTLRQVVQFYIRGGNFPATNFAETALGIVSLPTLDPGVDLANEAKIEALVAFLANGLTDQRVVNQQAPFDHPQLLIPNGSPDSNPGVDEFIEVPAVGNNGSTTPLSTFLDLDPQAP
jgi:cytochrome c peroxidase